MNETAIRKIVQDEMKRTSARNQYTVQSIPFHTHNGVDSQLIKEDNIVPGISISGSVTMASEATYVLKLNALFTPRTIFCTGNAGNGTQKYMFVGTAQLSPSFYFQPATTRVVVPGGPQYPFVDPDHPDWGNNIPMQSSSYFGTESATGTAHTLVGNFHIIDVQFPAGTSYARATVIDFSRDAITIVVDELASGWEINANFVVT